MIGISAWGVHIPRLRLSRSTAVAAMGWLVSGTAGKARGERAMCDWDEDTVTMAVEAARDALGPGDDRSQIVALHLATTTAPFVDRLNAGIVAGALTLESRIGAFDCTGTQRAGLSALAQAAAQVTAGSGDVLVVASEHRRARAGSAQELDWGDGAAALILSQDDVVAELIGSATVTADFVDHFRGAGETFDYQWEERWVRDEGFAVFVPQAIETALADAGVQGSAVTHFCLPSLHSGMGEKLARRLGIPAEAVSDTLALRMGEAGCAHALILLAGALEKAQPGDIIVAAQFGQGAEALVFRCTEAIRHYRPLRGLLGALEQRREETNYLKFLVFNDLVEWERGHRGERDNRTALSTLHRHASAIMGFVGGRCAQTGVVQFPSSRISVAPNAPGVDTQEPYKLAERRAHIVSWTADRLSHSMNPPQYYGAVDFEGGGRITMDFADLDERDVSIGSAMRMAFRIKDFDVRRGFRRYVWKAVPERVSLSGGA